MGEYIKHPEKQIEIKIGVADAKKRRCFLTKEALLELKQNGYQGFYGGEYDETIEEMLNAENTVYENISADKAEDEEVERLWDHFADIPFDSQNYRILIDFHIWSEGTSKDVIWGWFNQNHSKGLYYLMEECS